jgi:hypothetical protein
MVICQSSPHTTCLHCLIQYDERPAPNFVFIPLEFLSRQRTAPRFVFGPLGLFTSRTNNPHECLSSDRLLLRVAKRPTPSFVFGLLGLLTIGKSRPYLTNAMLDKFINWYDVSLAHVVTTRLSKATERYFDHLKVEMRIRHIFNCDSCPKFRDGLLSRKTVIAPRGTNSL